MNKKEKIKGIICVVLSALIFGLTPVFAAISYQEGNNGINMALIRSVLPIPFFFLITRRNKRTTLRQKRNGILLGVLLFSCVLTLYSSYLFISVGLATTLHFLYPLYVVLYERIFQGRKLGILRVAALILGLLGILFTVDLTGQSIHPAGAALAIVSGLFLTAYLVALEKENRQPMAIYQLMLYVSIGGAILCTVAGLSMHSLTLNITLKGWVFAAAAALLVSIGACALLQQGIRCIGKANAAFYSMLEPISSILFGLLLLNEHLTWRGYAGSLLIVGALTLTLFEKENPSKQPALDVKTE